MSGARCTDLTDHQRCRCLATIRYERQHPTLGNADTIKTDLRRARDDYFKMLTIWEAAARASIVQYH